MKVINAGRRLVVTTCNAPNIKVPARCQRRPIVGGETGGKSVGQIVVGDIDWL